MDVKGVDSGYLPLKDSAGEKDIKEVARDFEAVFINYLLKTMRKGVIKSDIFGNVKGEEIYRSLMDERLSEEIARAGGIGLAEMIIKELGEKR